MDEGIRVMIDAPRGAAWIPTEMDRATMARSISDAPRVRRTRSAALARATVAGTRLARTEGPATRTWVRLVAQGPAQGPALESRTETPEGRGRAMTPDALTSGRVMDEKVSRNGDVTIARLMLENARSTREGRIAIRALHAALRRV